jgi:hypothetical protein
MTIISNAPQEKDGYVKLIASARVPHRGSINQRRNVLSLAQMRCTSYNVSLSCNEGLTGVD